MSRPKLAPHVTLVCRSCGHTARRPLANVIACRGVHETACYPAFCPRGHGAMLRKDGGAVVDRA